LDAVALLDQYFAGTGEAFEIVLEHSRMVAAKALSIARRLSDPSINLAIVEEAALLHDIGVSRTHAPRIGCHGQAPYICHGVLGREILESEGLFVHALVCERHIGVGIGIEDIVRQQLPLPRREMVPVSLEERIVCFADLFFSKKPGFLQTEKTMTDIKAGLRKHGNHKADIFERWVLEFSR
jgi:uncharacterized protein